MLGRHARSESSPAEATALVIEIEPDPRSRQIPDVPILHNGTGMPLHLTLLYPFTTDRVPAPNELAAVRATLARFPPIDFQLVGTGSFLSTRQRVLYLVPDPAAPFVAMIDELSSATGRKPYGGAFPDVVPHVTVAIGAPSRVSWHPPGLPRWDANALTRRRIDRLRERLELLLPIRATASHADLWVSVQGRWERSRSGPFVFEARPSTEGDDGNPD
jgi:2'-5' RNA ligase